MSASSGSETPFSIVFEGLPGAGKTSCCEHLARDMQFVLLPEYVLDRDLVGSWRHSHRHSTTEIHLTNWIAKAGLASDPTQRYLLDRNHLTALAYHYARTQISGVDSYSAVRAWYEAAVAAGFLVEPACYVVFEVSPHVSLSRRELSEDPRYLWRDRDGLDHWATYYAGLATRPPWAFRDEPGPAIIQIDAEAPVSVVRRAVYGALSTMFPGAFQGRPDDGPREARDGA
jgi:thymidylate kinase